MIIIAMTKKIVTCNYITNLMPTDHNCVYSYICTNIYWNFWLRLWTKLSKCYLELVKPLSNQFVAYGTVQSPHYQSTVFSNPRTWNILGFRWSSLDSATSVCAKDLNAHNEIKAKKKRIVMAVNISSALHELFTNSQMINWYYSIFWIQFRSTVSYIFDIIDHFFILQDLVRTNVRVRMKF
jgi:hypothetical protein